MNNAKHKLYQTSHNGVAIHMNALAVLPSNFELNGIQTQNLDLFPQNQSHLQIIAVSHTKLFNLHFPTISLLKFPLTNVQYTEFRLFKAN